MKKVLSAMLAAIVTISLSGCARKEPKERGESSSTISDTGSRSSESSTEKEMVSNESSASEESLTPEESSSDSSPESSSDSSLDSSPESSSDSSYESGGGILEKITFESIYNDYSKRIEDTAAACINEMNSKKGDIDTIAEISSDGIDKIADLCSEGIDKMADRTLLGTSGYMEWSTKLTSLYTAKSSEITSAYMSAAMDGTLGDFSFDFNF